MNFDFTNYTFSGLLSILASLYGVGYPLIIQSIERIYSQYDSSLLSNRFTKEPVYKLFQILLVLNLLFTVLTPFLLHAGWWIIGCVTIQAILLVLLMGFTFLLFQLMIKYGNAGELLKYVEGKQIDKNNVMDILDLAIYADSKNNHQLFIDAMSSVFSYITIQQGDKQSLEEEDNILPPVEYDDIVLAIVMKLKGFIREGNGHHLLHRNNDIVSVLYNQISNSRISLRTHQWMWIMLNEAITHDNHSWFKQYWQFADSYASLRYRFVNNEQLRHDKKEFMLRHVIIGTLLLHNERYKWFNDIFLYTHSEPEYFGLIPSKFTQIIDMLENADKLCVVPTFQNQGFYFANEMGGVKDEKIVFREAVKYLSLLVIRLWSLQYQNLDGSEDLFSIPNSPKLIADDERAVSLMNMMISDIKYFYTNNIFVLVPRLTHIRQSEVIKLLTDYRDQCSSVKDTHEKHPEVSNDKFLKLKAEAMDFADRFNHTMPTEKPEGFEWNGVSTTNRTLIKEEKLETLYYSPYENFINGNLVLWANFMFELYRFYLDILNGIKRLSTYKVPRKQIQEFLNKIGYNVEDYEIITTDDIVEIQNSNVCLHAGVRPFGFFIIKRDEVPYITFEPFEEDKLTFMKEGCVLSSNIDSFRDCHEPFFNLQIATKMNVHTSGQSHGVVYISINDDYKTQDTHVVIEKSLVELYYV